MYKKAFEEAVNAIKSHPFVEVNQLVVNSPATPEQVDTFEMISGIRLPESIKALYLFANGITCTWSVKQGLPQEVMDKIRAEGEQLDFDYSKPLGAVKILSIQDMLLNKYWVPPFQNPPEESKEITFAGQHITLGMFARKLRLFDAYEVTNDSEGMALVADLPVNGVAFYLLILDEYLASWNQSCIIDFEIYFTAICKARFTIPSRKRLFGKTQMADAVIIDQTSLSKTQLAPALFS